MPLTRFRSDFPALQSVSESSPVYLDSACTCLRPEPVIRAISEFQRGTLSCHGRSLHAFGRATTEAYEGARARVAKFIGATNDQEVVFVRNTTEAINLLASCLPLRSGDGVLTTSLEHNSNMLPWQRLARTRGVRHLVHRVDVSVGFDLAAFRKDLRPGTRLIAVPHVSNLTGIEFDLAGIVEAAREIGAWVLVDGAQAVATHPVDVEALGVDFYAFSFHKIFGPAGIGALWGKMEHLERMPPFLAGGGTVSAATLTTARFEPPPIRFEAGVCNYEGAVGAAAAIDYLTSIGPSRLHEHVVALNRRATDALVGNRRFRLLGPRDAAKRGGIFGFWVEGLESEALARLLDTRVGVMIRHGKMCVHGFFDIEGIPDAARASFSVYNTLEEVDRFVDTVSGAISLLD